MALVPAKCTQCGGDVEVDNQKEAAICPFCGTAYIVEKAINNYAVNNNIYAQNVIVQSNNEFEIVAGELRGYHGESANVIIPDGVVKIGNHCFEMLNIQSVSIPDSVTEIDAFAFANCSSLKEITIPNSVKYIGIEAFHYCCNLEEITIPNSVTCIDKRAFSSCINLKKVIISNSISEIKAGTFEGCEKINNVNIPSGIVSIGDYAFQACDSLSDINIPNTVINIGEYAFYMCNNLKSINIPNTINNIGNNAFVSKNNQNQNESEKKACYIATCVYGSYDCPQVWTLRRFRDYILEEHWYGKVFIKCYYAVSPTLVKWFGNHKWFKGLWKITLDAMITKLNQQGIKDTEYNDK